MKDQKTDVGIETIGKENKDIPKIGEKTPKEKEYFTIVPLSPDVPIYKRGFIIGGRYTRNSSKNTPGKSSEKESKKKEK